MASLLYTLKKLGRLSEEPSPQASTFLCAIQTAFGTTTQNVLFSSSLRYIYIYIYIYTGCNRRNGPDLGRVFLMLNYTKKTQNTYIQS